MADDTDTVSKHFKKRPGAAHRGTAFSESGPDHAQERMSDESASNLPWEMSWRMYIFRMLRYSRSSNLDSRLKAVRIGTCPGHSIRDADEAAAGNVVWPSCCALQDLMFFA